MAKTLDTAGAACARLKDWLCRSKFNRSQPYGIPVSIYSNQPFSSQDLCELDRLAELHDFASLVTVEEGQPFISHIPVLYSRSDDVIVVAGHLARANRQAKDGSQALVVLHGPNAYVSPSWYPDKVERSRVPTWNYAVAHLTGTLECRDDDQWLAEHVGTLSERHERRAGGSWAFDSEAESERSMRRGIIGFRLRVRKFELKLKLSQNHPNANRQSVLAYLAKGNEAAQQVADLMRRSLARISD